MTNLSLSFAATGYIQSYSCCQGEANSEGCQVHSCHVTDVLDYNDMRGFGATLDKGGSDANPGVYALDCEMCNTVRGNELTRVTVIDIDGATKYETLVMPQNDIIDYNTRSVSSASINDSRLTKIGDIT